MFQTRGRRAEPGVFIICGLGLSLLVAGAAQSVPVAAQPGMGEPLNGLTQEQLQRFLTGKANFIRDFTAPEGLGPIFNETACGDCHATGPGGPGTQKVFRAGKITKTGFDPLAEYGGSLFQLQAISPQCQETPPPQANISTDRVTNGMMGYGLVEAIQETNIQYYQDNPPGQDPIGGRVNMVPALEDQSLRVGRFGWKAQAATTMTFAADALLEEMGITNPLRPVDNDPNGIDPPDLAGCDTVADPEVDMAFVQSLVDFQRFLAPPPQTPRFGMAGEGLFKQIGCADCHIAWYRSGDDPRLESAIRGKLVGTYSDFLLHRMSLNSDGIEQDGAAGDEIRTAPLMGLRVRDPMWHDGRIEGGTFENRVTAAIALHDDGDIDLSQGRFAARRFFQDLTGAERQATMAFLESLGRREFDLTGDNQVTILDFAFSGNPTSFRSCYGGGPYNPDHPCAIHDADRDTDSDLADFDIFLTVYDGLLSDCNGNGSLDLIDILNNPALDADDDGVPDSCQPTCLGDTDGDAQVTVIDFLRVLADWGACPALPAPCPGDLDGDMQVGILDFFEVLSRWGACP